MRFLCCSFAVTLTILLGCDRPAKPKAATTKRTQQQASTQQTALLRSIRKQLRTLPEATDMVLRPPLVVLDKRATRDGEDIEAVLQREPGSLEGPANQLVVVKGGVNFRDKVRPGDTAKYYVSYDDETMERLREGGDVGIATYRATDLRVAQVLGNDRLLIEGGAAEEWNVPSKLEVWRIADDRMNKIQRELGSYVVKRDPPLAWHPSPDAATISQLTERINQWLRQSKLAGSKATEDKRTPSALLETLPESLTKNAELAAFIGPKDQSSGYFRDYEVRQVQGAIWRRDVARWARGSDNGTMAVARSLFDWTIRNVQLVEADEAPPRWPWEIMLHGQATAAGRAWVFAGLCEQQNLTAAVVTIPIDADSARLLVGVLDGDALRLFDPQLGLPIRAADGVSVASLAEIGSDETLLQQFDLDGAPYPVTSELAKAARVQLVATPLALTRRAAGLSSQLTAENAVVLTTDLDAAAERLKSLPSVSDVSLWSLPHQTLLDKLNAKRSFRNQAVRDFLPFAWRPRLWRARTQHFRGKIATAEEQAATTAETADDHRDARRYYTSPSVRPSDRTLERQPPEKQAIYGSAKVVATLNLGLLIYEEGSYDVAKAWLENATLETEASASYRPATLYNLARTYEKLGKVDKAIKLLEAIEGPSAPGAKLLARRLADEQAGEADGEEPEEAEPEASEDESTPPAAGDE